MDHIHGEARLLEPTAEAGREAVIVLNEEDSHCCSLAALS
jgi:hypothetical protein